MPDHHVLDPREDADWTEFLQRDIRPHDVWTSILLIRVFSNGAVRDGEVVRDSFRPLGYVFVTDESHATPRVKMPSGDKQPGENPRQTAAEHARKQTGLAIPPSHIRYVNCQGGVESQRTCLFVTDVEEEQAQSVHGNDPGNQGAVPRYYSRAELIRLLKDKQFLTFHAYRLNNARLI